MLSLDYIAVCDILYVCVCACVCCDTGEGDAFCDGQHIPVQAGDCIVFPPGSLHGLDNNTDRKLYALQVSVRMA